MITINDVLSRLEGVTGGNGQYTAKCPCHADKKASLSVHAGTKGIVLHCHAGCAPADVAAAIGLSMQELFYDDEQADPEAKAAGRPHSAPQTGKRELVAVYKYNNGTEKVRYSDKSFLWRRSDGAGGYLIGRGDAPRCLYAPRGIGAGVLIVEGEKDAETAAAMGWGAVSGEDGAGKGKWREEYTAQLAGLEAVYIIPDNDEIGREYAEEVARALFGKVDEVYLLDLLSVWPDCPPHGDLTDMRDTLGAEVAEMALNKLTTEARPYSPPKSPLLALVKRLDEIEEREPAWLVPGWIPCNQIVLLGADGGVGKTTLWCNILAALSAGKACVLDPEGHTREPLRVLFLTTEDSVAARLKKKLRLAGAREDNVLVIDPAEDRNDLFQTIKFCTPQLAEIVRAYRPALVVFDPVQGFIPPTVNMGMRNEMRACLSPLIALGEETGTAFLIVCHTNKREGSDARRSLADSADLWDIARGVMMAGWTDREGERFLSNEKNNYGALSETLLFKIDENGQIVTTGRSWKRYRDFQQDASAAKSPTKREDCEGFILSTLAAHGGRMETKELRDAAETHEYGGTYKRASDALKKAGKIIAYSTGYSKDKVWYTKLGNVAGLEVAEADEENPFTDNEQMTMKEDADNG